MKKEIKNVLVCHCKYSSILYRFWVIWRWIISWPWNVGQRSLKVIQTSTIRNLGCSFLFAYSNYGSILHQFRDKTWYWSKIVIFSYPLAVPDWPFGGPYADTKWGALLTPPPFPSLPFRSLPFLSLPFPSSFPSRPLQVGPLNTARGLGGALWAPSAGSGAEPQRKSNLVHFSLKIWHLVAPILLIFMKKSICFKKKLHKKTFSLRIFSAHNAKTHWCCQQKLRHTTNCNHNVT